MRKPFAERFWDKVDKAGECWIWNGARYGNYGITKVGKRRVGAHRVAYELSVGPIPEGLQIDHLCRNCVCVNPSHLEPVTLVENVMRGVSPWATNARKTHCSRGHEFTADNLVPNRSTRQCMTCRRENWQRENERRRQTRIGQPCQPAA